MTSTSGPNSQGFSLKALSIIFLVHFTGDFYQSFFGPMLPLIQTSIGLSLTQVGLLVGVITLTSYLAQPVMGLLADRYGPRMFMISGLLISAVFIPLMAVIPWFLLLIPLAALGAVGSSMYHPTAAGMVSQFGGERAGFSMSIFGLGGTLGFAVGPLVVTLLVDYFGLINLPFAASYGLLAVLAAIMLLPQPERRPVSQKGLLDDMKHGLGPAWKPIVILWLIGSLRSLADVALRTFYPIMHLESGESIVSMGVVLSLLILGGSASAMVCGTLADRRGYKLIFYVSYALATPCIIGFVYSTGWWVYPASFITGFMLLASMFPAVALANQLAPHNRALASSLTLGFAVGTGGIVSPLVGQLADYLGIKEALLIVGFVPLLCLFLVPAIPDRAETPGQEAPAQAAG